MKKKKFLLGFFAMYTQWMLYAVHGGVKCITVGFCSVWIIWWIIRMCMACLLAKGVENEIKNKIKKWESERAKMSERKKILEWGDEEEKEEKVERVEGGLFEFFSRLAFFLALFLWYEYMLLLYDTTMLLMLLMWWWQWAGMREQERSVIFKWRMRRRVVKKYTYSQFSLWNKSHTFFSSIICMFSEAPWMLYVLPHFLSMDITWRNIHVYKFCSLYHSWTLLNTKKWARNINIVIEWIDKRAFLPLLRWLHTSEWIEDFLNRQINCWKKTWEIFRMRLGSETIR